MRLNGRVGSLLVAVTMLSAACAAGESGEGTSTGSSADSLLDTIDTIETDETDETREPVAQAAGTVRRDVGLALRPESEVPTNPLPPVEVHDVGQDRMVNFKNIFPAERPVLLWMWAPY